MFVMRCEISINGFLLGYALLAQLDSHSSISRCIICNKVIIYDLFFKCIFSILSCTVEVISRNHAGSLTFIYNFKRWLRVTGLLIPYVQSPCRLMKEESMHLPSKIVNSNFQQRKSMILFLRALRCDNARLILLNSMYLNGSCECISMGRGVPPGPPRVRASMKPRTTAHLRAVPNSSRVYLTKQRRTTFNTQTCVKMHVFVCLSVAVADIDPESRQVFQNGKTLGLFYLAVSAFVTD